MIPVSEMEVADSPPLLRRKRASGTTYADSREQVLNVGVPSWARLERMPENLETAAFSAGAALSALDAVVRRGERSAGAWRQRLALAAAEACARRAGRTEDVAALRDAFFLTRPGDDFGPAGRMLVGWKQLAASDAAFGRVRVAAAIEAFGLRPEEELVEAASACETLARDPTAPALVAAAEAVRMVVAASPEAMPLGLWLADLVLSTKLRWPHPVPLLATRIFDRSGANGRAARPGDESWQLACAHAYARAAAAACDGAMEIARRAERLVVVAPKLRAKGADAIVERLLREDALTVAAASGARLSDRALRRLFDRLVELGAVRELTGRDTFRIYGL